MIRHLRNSSIVLAALVVLGACAGQRGVLLPEMNNWETRQAILASLDRWEFQGRIGVSAGTEGFNGKLRWKQRDDNFEATVSGPLGAGAIEIDGGRHGVRLTDRDGAVTEMQNPELDFRERYGWTIPVRSLRYWALGIPEPGLEALTEFDAGGQLVRLEQRDWVITISQYREGGGQPMPRRVAVVNADAKVRLVIDNWLYG